MAAMDFVFMLTRNDATVANALELVEGARQLGISHIGFKDVGAEASQLKRLTEAIRAAGAAAWMEVVSTSREEELRSIALGAAAAKRICDRWLNVRNRRKPAVADRDRERRKWEGKRP